MNFPSENKKIAVIGGDMRQIYSAIEIADRGYEVAVCGFDLYTDDLGLCTRCDNVCDSLNNSCAVILPIPVTNDGINLFSPYSDVKIPVDKFFLCLPKNIVVLGGRTGGIGRDFGVDVYDYFEREELVIANAYLTAESAVAIAMNEMSESLRDVNVLVMGYGRIGKSLCHILKGMGVNVYASARKKSDFSWIRAFGYSPIDTSKICDIVASCGLIFNTIPNLVLGEEILCCLPKDCLIIDLASKPGGVDFKAAKKCGLKTLWALGLPGKNLPVSAGKIQASVILDILDDKGVI